MCAGKRLVPENMGGTLASSDHNSAHALSCFRIMHIFCANVHTKRVGHLSELVTSPKQRAHPPSTTMPQPKRTHSAYTEVDISRASSAIDQGIFFQACDALQLRTASLEALF
jgi:hypothetical protein